MAVQVDLRVLPTLHSFPRYATKYQVEDWAILSSRTLVVPANAIAPFHYVSVAPIGHVRSSPACLLASQRKRCLHVFE